MTSTYHLKNNCSKTFNVAALIVYCIVQVSQVLSRSKFLETQYLKKSLLNRVHPLLFSRKGNLQEITIISRITFVLMYVCNSLKRLLIGLVVFPKLLYVFFYIDLVVDCIVCILYLLTSGDIYIF